MPRPRTQEKRNIMPELEVVQTTDGKYFKCPKCDTNLPLRDILPPEGGIVKCDRCLSELMLRVRITELGKLVGEYN